MSWKKTMIYVLSVVILLLLVGGIAIYDWMGKGMFEPGSVAARPASDFAPPREHPSEDSFWQVTPDVKLFHFSEGSGKDVLVVHGGPGIPPMKSWQVAASNGDVARFHFYHQRGAGRSTRPIDKPEEQGLYPQMVAVEKTLGLGAQIADIERVRRILNQDKLVLVGHSFGALIAALYAAEFPEHVSALVCVSPADLVVFPKEGDDLFQIVESRLPSHLKDEYQKYMRDYFDFKVLFSKDEAQLSAFFSRFGKYYSAASGDQELGSTVNESQNISGGWMPLGVYLSLGRRHDFRLALAKIDAPVLVIHGSKDMIPESDSRHFASYFRNANVTVIQDAGHFPFEDKPQEVASEMKNFLGLISQPAKP